MNVLGANAWKNQEIDMKMHSRRFEAVGKLSISSESRKRYDWSELYC